MVRRTVLGTLCALACGTASAFAPQAVASQSATAPAGDAILVLDASGSMWGRIDGVPRIVIAREVISSLLDELPANRRLGLVAYGHNRKGDCADIETLVEVGTDRDAIRAAVEGINPKGKTPMTAAVKQAAETLKYSEDAATVILISDGLETCGLDPCEVAGTLEKSGVGLTVHTVGFGLGDDEETAKAQLRCMAANTGGRSLLASDAEELAAALQEVSVATAPPAPPPAEPVQSSASVQAPASAPAGSKVRVAWTGPDNDGDYIAVARPDADGSDHINYTRTNDGSPLELKLPDEPGSYEVRYLVRETRDILARQAIEATPVAATLDAPATAAAGSTIDVTWSGPGYPGDYIAIAAPDADGPDHINYTRTGDENPLELRLPDEPGNYELRYMLRQSRSILAEKAIELTPVTATLDAPGTAAAGSTIEVSWTGPDYRGDYIAIARPDADGSDHINYTRTGDGDPLELRLPDEPGSYELRYMLRQTRGILAEKAIDLTPVTATLDAPATAAAGSTIEVSWTGPDYRGDYIAIAKPNAEGADHITYTRTNDGSPLEITMPEEPGRYEVRYMLRQSRGVLAHEPIEVR